ncbi:MAG TPA: hypothetical protein VJQ43_06750 [Thermoplasmata archaeon]|nr:hypothetical protein [Thermoplasmata archaeon]
MPALFALTSDLAADVIVALAMVVVEVFVLTQIVPRSGPPAPLTRMVIGSSALVGSSGVLMALLGAYLAPNLSNYSVVLLAFNFMMLGPPGLWFIALIVFEDRTIRPERWLWPVTITVMATSTEVLMGVFFTVAGGSALDPASVLAGTLTSAWFLWSMAGAMVALLLWVPLEPAVRRPLLGLAAAGIVAPLVPVDPALGALLMGVVMAVTVLDSLERARSARSISPRSGRVLTGVVAAFLAMNVAGAAVAIAPSAVGATLAFGTVMAIAMTIEFLVILREGLHPTLSLQGPVGLPDAPRPRAGSAGPAPAASRP